MCILMILYLSEEYVHVKHVSVSKVMNESISMSRYQFYENGNYMKGVLTHTHYE